MCGYIELTGNKLPRGNMIKLIAINSIHANNAKLHVEAIGLKVALAGRAVLIAGDWNDLTIEIHNALTAIMRRAMAYTETHTQWDEEFFNEKN